MYNACIIKVTDTKNNFAYRHYRKAWAVLPKGESHFGLLRSTLLLLNSRVVFFLLFFYVCVCVAGGGGGGGGKIKKIKNVIRKTNQ